MESDFQKCTFLEPCAGGTQSRGEGIWLKGGAYCREPTWRPKGNIVGGCGGSHVAQRRSSCSV